ncbi:MAG: hypothetical protein LBM13_05300, partial [Candidatus Ancillula sp.]|nr:hypothetical protein [Candidatus Ancillula sp.]
MKKIKFLGFLLACAFFTGSLCSCEDNVPTVITATSSNSVSLSTTQEEKIRATVLTTIAKAERENNYELLETRAGGPELLLRQSQMKIEQSSGSKDDNMDIPTTSRNVMISNSALWPRDTFVVTNTGGEKQTERLLVFNQESVRSNYKLWGLVRLFSGISMPAFEVADSGSAQISADDQTLADTPTNIFMQYADVLEKGDKSEYFKKFDGDELQTQINDSVGLASNSLVAVGGGQSQTYALKPGEIRGLQTYDSGAV